MAVVNAYVKVVAMETNEHSKASIGVHTIYGCLTTNKVIE